MDVDVLTDMLTDCSGCWAEEGTGWEPWSSQRTADGGWTSMEEERSGGF